MKRTLLLIALALLAPGMARGATLPETTEQVKQGRQLFRRSAKGLACATCHSMEGFGNAVGPDLGRISAVVAPRGMVQTIQMSMTAYVQEFRLSNGITFPGIQKKKENGVVSIWDLSRTPPMLTRHKESDITAMKPNSAWQHPPALTGYSPQELANIIGYLKFVATGVEKEVTVEDLR